MFGNSAIFSSRRITLLDIVPPTQPVVTYSNIATTTILMTATSTDNVGVVGYNIYLDAVLYQYVAGASFTNYQLTGLSPNTNYDLFVTAKDAAGNVSSASTIYNFTTIADTIPTLTNFNIINTQTSRVYFNSTASVAGLAVTGFKINDKTISSITINGTSTTGHYITVSTPFKYGEVVNIECLGGTGTIKDFPKDYVANNILYVGAERWVTPTGAGAKNGTNLANAYSMTELNSASLTAPMRVNIAKGNYTGTLTAKNGNAGTGEYIIYEGYNNSPGDMNYAVYHPNYGDVLNANYMPLFDGGGGSTTFCSMMTQNYTHIIFKNIQVTNYYQGWRNQHASWSLKNIQWDNVVASPGSISGSYGSGIIIQYKIEHTVKPIYNKIVNSLFVNWTIENCSIDSDEGFLYNVKSYSDRTIQADDTDYLIRIARGTNLVVRKCHAEKVGDTGHTGHGIAFKAGEDSSTADAKIENSYIIDCTVKNTAGAIQFRHSHSKNNFAINCTIDGSGGNADTGGIVFRDGANGNTADGCYVSGVKDASYGGVTFCETTEDYANQVVSGNIIKNSIFIGNATNNSFINFGGGPANLAMTATGNKFYNNTVYGYQNLYRRYTTCVDGGGNEFKNNLFVNIPDRLYDSNFVTLSADSNNNYYNFTSDTGNPIGTNGNIDVNPNFVNTVDFVPQTTMYVDRINTVQYDHNGKVRANPTTIGAVTHSAEGV